MANFIQQIASGLQNTSTFVKEKVAAVVQHPLASKAIKIAAIATVTHQLYNSNIFSLETCTTSRNWWFQTVTHCEPTHFGHLASFFKKNFLLISGLLSAAVVYWNERQPRPLPE